MRNRTVLPLLLVVVCLWASVFAQVKTVKSYKREMELQWREGQLELSMDFPEVFTERLRKRLSNGFTSRILIEVLLRESKKKTPVAQTIVQYTIIYDIWEEKFNVRGEGPAGRRDVQLSSMADLIRTYGKFNRLPLNLLVELPAGMKCGMMVRIVVNPMSAELRKKIREYLSNPDGSSHIGSPRSFFGSFSRIFVDEKAFQADAVHTFRSPNMVIAPRPGLE